MISAKPWLFRLAADLCPKFEEKSLPLLAKLVTTLPHIFADEEYNIFLQLTLRRQKILLYDPIQQ